MFRYVKLAFGIDSAVAISLKETFEQFHQSGMIQQQYAIE
jgi:hypothetical protein